MENPDTLYRALTARDRRFDGLFFVGVTSTRIYCRPVCPVKPPKAANCRFYKTAQEAEQAGFRPCLRCRPELAPGNAPVDGAQRIAESVVRRIEEGSMENEAGLEAMASAFALSSRQIRRIIQKELGVPPMQLILTRRLLLAKQLLTETRLPVTEIAYASGFASLRRFNDAFVTRYRMPPTRLRRAAAESPGVLNGIGTSTLQLSYRPPYDWDGMLAFLKTREVKGVEWVGPDFYARTVRLGKSKGWIKIRHEMAKTVLTLEFSHSLSPVLPALLNRVRDLFDLNARPDVIAKHLGRDPVLEASVKANPGLRVPGAFNGFELGLRAIIGQQVTVRTATTMAGRVVAALGEPLVTPFPELNRLALLPETVVRAGENRLGALGVIRTRGRAMISLAQGQMSGQLRLEGGHHQDPEASIARLTELPGIGLWTAHYIAMRALRWPDAFPSGDVALRNRLGGITAREAEERSEAWRPWRSYAVLHLWNSARRENAASGCAG